MGTQAPDEWPWPQTEVPVVPGVDPWHPWNNPQIHGYMRTSVSSDNQIHHNFEAPAVQPLALPAVEVVVAKSKLHPFQIVTYSVVIATCLIVLYSLLETYLFLGRLQEALQQLAESFQVG